MNYDDPCKDSEFVLDASVKILDALHLSMRKSSWKDGYLTREAKYIVDSAFMKIQGRFIKKIPNITKEELKLLGFRPVEVNNLVTLWYVPIYLVNALPDGLVLHNRDGQKITVGKDHIPERGPTNHRYAPVNNHIQWGFLEVPVEEEST